VSIFSLDADVCGAKHRSGRSHAGGIVVTSQAVAGPRITVAEASRVAARQVGCSCRSRAPRVPAGCG